MLPEIIWICRFGLANLYEEKKKKTVISFFESNLMALFLYSIVDENGHPQKNVRTGVPFMFDHQIQSPQFYTDFTLQQTKVQVV